MPYFYFLPVLRASFILSPGVNSEAPLDMPVVEESFILSPGENSEAPREVGEVELFIWGPGANPEAPLAPDEPAKLRLDEPISMAVAATINVLFMSFSCFRWVLVVEPKGWADEKVLRYQ
jgi:hypothetical protein